MLWTQNGAGAGRARLSRMRERIVRSPGADPRILGWPFSTWSLSKLRDVLVAARSSSISRETLRQILKEGGVSWQATKTWKASNDPDFAAKMARVLDLYDNPPADGRVVCVDEFGPLNLQPRAGRGWFPRAPPESVAGHLQPHTGSAAHVRCAGPGHRPALLPDP